MDPRQVTLALCLPSGEMLGTTPEFVVEVPWWQEVGPVVDAARAQLGLDVRILRILDGPAWSGPPAGGRVVYLAEVDRGPSMALAAWTGPDPMGDHPLRQSWARPRGPSADLACATEALAPQGMSPSGRIRQLRSWNLSSSWRLPTDGGPVWLKVVPPFFAHEPALAVEGLVTDLPNRFAAIAACRLPDTLVHGDFHLGNIKGDPHRPDDGFTILDWGDSGIGNPMLDQLASARFLPLDDRPAVEAEWARLWRDAVPRSDPERAADLLRPITALREAAVYQRFLDNIEPDEHRYHDGDPATQLRFTAALAAGEC